MTAAALAPFVAALLLQTPAPRSATPTTAAAVVAAVPTPAQQREQRLTEIKTELDTRRAALLDLDNKKRSLVDSIGGLDESLARLADESAAAKKQLDHLAAELAELKASSGLDEDELAAARGRLDARLRALVVTGEGGAARALLGAEGFEELALRRRLLRNLAESDAKLVDDVARAEKTVSDRRARLKAAEEDARDLAAQVEEQKQLTLATRDERAAALTRIAQERALQERAERELSQQRENLAALIKKLADDAARSTAPAPVPRRGKGILGRRLPWPVDGAVIRRFGVVVDKDSRAEVVSNGIEVRADAGTPVQAVADGRVVYVGWLRGFGRVVIIDHGEGHHTLSAHLERAAIEAGDDVRSGQTVGFVGDTESTNGPKLYFELRDHGRPRDPSPYLR